MRNYIMDNKILTPYRTASGIEIGKRYTPPKERDIRVDYIDIYDQELLQMAYIGDSSEIRMEKLVTISCVFAAILFVLILVFLTAP
jgi:pimeloyl-CoA synthetase